MSDLTIMSQNKEKILLFLLILPGILGGTFAFNLSYFSNTNVLIGFCLLPFTFIIAGTRRNNFVYVGLVVVFAGLTLAYGVRIFYFFALAFYVLWICELFVGRLSVLIVFLIVFMSPFFIQVVTILGFPIRLMLSAFAGTLLNMVGMDVEVQGNMMVLDGATFSVDDACMGLNMLVISMLMGVFVLAFRSRVSGTTLGLGFTGTFFIVALILNMIANVIRIITLIYFRIMPGNVMHEFVGILCLVVYVVIPLHFLAGWLVRKYGKPREDTVSGSTFNWRRMVPVAVLSLLVFSVGTTAEGRRSASRSAHASVQFRGNTPELLADGIAKIATNDLLIYVKSIPEFFTGEHTPLMCWKGSGFKFSGVSTAKVAGVSIYVGTLVKDGKSLHTAWWYSNGETETISQWNWRRRMLQGEADFCLVNVTAEDERTLMAAVKSMFTTDPIWIKC